ncbi:MAG: glycolate oxidase subunit GlcE [Telluria sp.]
MIQVLEEFSARISAARAAGTALRLRGGGTKDWYGQDMQGEVFDTRAYRGIVAYDPTELFITARCGTPLAEVEAALAAQGQMLAFEPPHFGPGATIGGAVASGLAGPRRQAQGALRDFVLGAVLMDGAGQVAHFGGQVMKNVAGYDVSRLLAGSLGTLGLILEVSLKVLPRPPAEATLRFELGQDEAIRRLNTWGGQPLPISASAWHDDLLTVRLSGAAPAVEAAARHMGGADFPDAGPFWLGVRELQHDFFAGDAPLWRLSLPSTAPPLAEGGAQLIEWGGAQRWTRSALPAGELRAALRARGGHATQFRGGRRADVFEPLALPIAAIHRNLKRAFDPAGVFNPGRMYKDF